MTKSIFWEVNLDMGIGNGCSRKVGKDVESVVFFQISHAKMKHILATKHEQTRSKQASWGQGGYQSQRYEIFSWAYNMHCIL